MDIPAAPLTSCATVPQLARLMTRALAVLAAPAVLLGGCADGDATPQETVTRTVVVPSSTEPTATEEPEGGGEEVGDRAHDAGTVVGVTETDDGQVVLELDRWTVVGVDDAVLAREGVPVVPHTGDRFTNQNAERTYRVPVAPDVQVVLNECVPPSTEGASPGLSSTPATLQDFLDLPDLHSVVVLLTYDAGQLTRLETDPRC